MSTNFVFASVLASILLGGVFGLFLIDNAFAQNLYVSSDDSEEKQKELEQKKAERQQQAEEKQKELEQKKAELETQRENFEAKQIKKLNEYEEKLKKIKETSLSKNEKITSDNSNKISQKSKQLETKLTKKSEEIQQKLEAKSDNLDLRTKKILDKINSGNYMGEKTTTDNFAETYELVFDSVNATGLKDNSQTSSFTGKMIFTTFDKSKSDLKLELSECQITVDEIIFNCAFGKARTVSSGQSDVKDSLIIMAFLEDDVLEEVHTTLKIFLNANTPINEIDNSKVTILHPQSMISNLWILNGTATMSKIVSTTESISSGNDSDNSSQDEILTSDK
ncbi:MAG: hypothetical protein K8Q89_08650 [Nitrosarchaeum sp.]|nr:hypothetical protein [Nitrosarchaeum sp.]